MRFLRQRVGASVVGIVIWMNAGSDGARAGMIMNATQVGQTVVFNYAGTLDVSALTHQGTSLVGGQFVDPNYGNFWSSGAAGTYYTEYGATFTPNDGVGSFFGTGSNATGLSSAGDPFGFSFFVNNTLAVPGGYSSGSNIAGTATFSGTIEQLGLARGSFIYQINNSSTNTITVNVEAVPEPSCSMIAGLGAAGLIARALYGSGKGRCFPKPVC